MDTIYDHGTPITDRGPASQVASGKLVYPLDLKPQDIDIRDIAHSLSNLCRFTGHVREFYSVAQHSVLVSHVVPRQYALAGLLHDAAEAYAGGDISRPVKIALDHVTGGRNWRVFIEDIDYTIAQKFGLTWPMPACIKEADDRVVNTEKRDLLPNPNVDWGPMPDPLPDRIVPLPPHRARMAFLLRFHRLTEGGRT